MNVCPNREKSSGSTKIVFISLLVILLLAAIAGIFMITRFSRRFSDDPNAIAAESVVTLTMYDANGIAIGTESGFAAFDKDILITNYRCIDGNVYSIEALRKNGTSFPIDSIVDYDAEKDIAILRAPNCGLTPLKTDGKDIDLSTPIEDAQALYDSRTPEGEISITAWYAQRDHTYTADYIMTYGSKLHAQTVTACGYIAGMDADIYLVPSPNDVVFLDMRTDFDLTASMKLQELRSSGRALQVDTAQNQIFTDDLSPGELITVEGTVMAYNASDIRLIAHSIDKSA